MKRIYMDLTEENHLRFKQLAKDDKRTLKGFLEYAVNDLINKTIKRKEVKKNDKKRSKK